jgi:c-di-GMP-binding flagellar brake protein YcgR
MKFDTTPSLDLDRYMVRNPAEVRRILRNVMHEKTLLTACTEDGKHCILTSILGVESERNSLYLDRGPDAPMNARLTTGKGVTLSTQHERVRVQFSVPPFTNVDYDQGPAFRVPLPAQLLRLQRREYYRLITSVVNPIKCLIETAQGTLESTVIDISIGGVGILAYQRGFQLDMGKVYNGCRLNLPDAGQFTVSLNVRSVFDIVLKNGRHSHRAGCQFIDLPGSLETDIQRYIIRMERERRNRL